MRVRRLSLFLALAINSATLVAQARPESTDMVSPTIRAQLLAARIAVWTAWFKGDSAALSKLLPSAVAAGDGGGWQSRAETMAASAQFAQEGGRLVSLTFDSTTISLHGDVAVLQARYRLVLRQKGTPHEEKGFATEVFVKQNGRWLNPLWNLGP